MPQPADFDQNQYAFYDAHVLEIPNPRWTTYDAHAFDQQPSGDAPAWTQERVNTSTVWFTPSTD